MNYTTICILEGAKRLRPDEAKVSRKAYGRTSYDEVQLGDE